jgi:hypothetical protein
MLSNNAFAQLKDDLELNVFGAGSIYTKNTYEIGFPQAAGVAHDPDPIRARLDEWHRTSPRLIA